MGRYMRGDVVGVGYPGAIGRCRKGEDELSCRGEHDYGV